MINEKKTLMNNTFSLYAMNIVKLIFPLLTLPYLTRILSTETYGVVTYVKSLIVYVQLFLDFGFLLSATKNIVVAKNNKKKINSIIGNTLFEKIILGVFASFTALPSVFSFIPKPSNIISITGPFSIIFIPFQFK